MMNLTEIRMDNGQLPRYAWPGGYGIAYVTDDAAFLCADCANADGHQNEDWRGDGWFIEGYQTADWADGEAWNCAHCDKDIAQ